MAPFLYELRMIFVRNFAKSGPSTFTHNGVAYTRFDQLTADERVMAKLTADYVELPKNSTLSMAYLWWQFRHLDGRVDVTLLDSYEIDNELLLYFIRRMIESATPPIDKKMKGVAEYCGVHNLSLVVVHNEYWDTTINICKKYGIPITEDR